MNKRIYIILILIAVTFGYAIVQSLVLEKKLADNRVLESNSVLQELPQVTMPIYKEEASVDFIEANKEQTIVVHFWASWCGPCEKEFPTLIKLTEELVDNESIKFLFVIVNDTPKEIDKFLSKFPALSKNVTLLVDNESLHQKHFGSFRLPETFVFGKDSSSIRRFTGEQEWDNGFYFSYLSRL